MFVGIIVLVFSALIAASNAQDSTSDNRSGWLSSLFYPDAFPFLFKNDNTYDDYQQYYGPQFGRGFCYPPYKPPFGKFLPNDDLFWSDGKVKFTCYPGYNLIGASEAVCLRTGDWSQNTPTCRRSYLPCVGPVDFANGYFSPLQAEYYHGDTCTFTCYNGYVLEGASTCTCNYGQWSHSAPRCVRRSICLQPSNLGVYLLIANRQSYWSYGDYIQYKCSTGYYSTGNMRVMCDYDGLWNNDPPTCRPYKRCYRPVSLPAYLIISNTRSYWNNGDYIEYNCGSGYHSSGVMRARCNYDGRWDRDPPRCSRYNRCYRPTLPPFVVIARSKNYWAYNEYIEFSCRSGYRSSGTMRARCQSDGRWDRSPPTCSLIYRRCYKPLNLPSYLLVSNPRSYWNYNDVITFACISGYYSSGTMTAICTSAGTWDRGLPVCTRARQCRRPSLPSFVLLINARTIFAFGDTITFRCRSGYRNRGSLSARCRRDGTWDNFPPRCYL